MADYNTNLPLSFPLDAGYKTNKNKPDRRPFKLSREKYLKLGVLDFFSTAPKN